MKLKKISARDSPALAISALSHPGDSFSCGTCGSTFVDLFLALRHRAYRCKTPSRPSAEIPSPSRLLLHETCPAVSQPSEPTTQEVANSIKLHFQLAAAEREKVCQEVHQSLAERDICLHQLESQIAASHHELQELQQTFEAANRGKSHCVEVLSAQVDRVREVCDRLAPADAPKASTHSGKSDPVRSSILQKENESDRQKQAKLVDQILIFNLPEKHAALSDREQTSTILRSLGAVAEISQLQRLGSRSPGQYHPECRPLFVKLLGQSATAVVQLFLKQKHQNPATGVPAALKIVPRRTSYFREALKRMYLVVSEVRRHMPELNPIIVNGEAVKFCTGECFPVYQFMFESFKLSDGTTIQVPLQSVPTHLAIS